MILDPLFMFALSRVACLADRKSFFVVCRPVERTGARAGRPFAYSHTNTYGRESSRQALCRRRSSEEQTKPFLPSTPSK